MRGMGSGTAKRLFFLAAGLSLATILGCATDELGPGGDAEGFPVWIAQSVSGTVQHLDTGQPIPGATVILTAGFELDQLFPIGGRIATTNSTGSFSFVRANDTGVPGDFWFFLVGDTAPRTIFVQLEVRHADYLPVFPRQQLGRTPTKNPPTGSSLGAYSLTINAPMRPVPEE